MPLQQTYRPETISDFFGNRPLVEGLQAVLERDEDIPQVYLITGPSGIGKTTLAYIIANTIKCLPQSIHLYNSANTRGIDTTREIASACQYPPIFGDISVYILDEFHQVTSTAQDALLLPLENPPKHAFFILCTTDPQKVKPAIKRRCHIIKLKAETSVVITKYLHTILEKEEIDKEEFAKVVPYISKNCNGSFGVAASMLDSVIDMVDEDLACQALTANNNEEDPETIELCRAVLKSDWQTASAFLKQYKGDPETARYSVMNYLSAVLLNKGSEQIAIKISYFLDSFQYTKKAGLISAVFSATH